MDLYKKPLTFAIKFYRKYLTLLSYGSCRYHPTCSSYALSQYEHNNFFMASFNSFVRILKCNQLFNGGFDYPVIYRKITKCKFKRIKVKYWLIPQGENKFLLVKNWEKNNN